MSELKQNIIKNRPLENIGPPASNRFDFQKDWTLCKIIELHENPNDYLVILEFHDDVIVFHYSTNPSRLVKVPTGQQMIKLVEKGKNGFLNSHLSIEYEDGKFDFV